MRTTATGCSTPSRTTPRSMFADLHEDGRYLYPGTGAAEETGRGAAPAPSSTCRCRRAPTMRRSRSVWPQVIAHLERSSRSSSSCSAVPTASRAIRSRTCGSQPSARRGGARAVRARRPLGHGRVLALGGGGYNRANLAQRLERGGREPDLAAQAARSLSRTFRGAIGYNRRAVFRYNPSRTVSRQGSAHVSQTMTIEGFDPELARRSRASGSARRTTSSSSPRRTTPARACSRRRARC